jgi:solute carrier family 35, member E1
MAKIFPVLKVWIPALKYEIRPPTRDLLVTTIPLTFFQIGGHILTSDAMSRIPVSLVHTIKGLSPLFTVLAYRFFYHIHYRPATYLSLIPLTLGVIMATSADFRGNFLGVFYAFASTFIFVTQNIVSKKLFNEAAQAEADGMPQSIRNRKPDKLNLLCYSAGLGFILTFPLWLWSEGVGLIGEILTSASVDLSEKPGSLDHGRLALEFFFNGSFHFGQSLIAFILLGMVSPVTYSVASLIKRVAVICFALIWFGNAVTGIQGAGIGLTFLGLYLYDRTSDAAKADRRARVQQMRSDTVNQNLLPVRNNPREFVFPAAPPSSGPASARLAPTLDTNYNYYSESPVAMSAGPHAGPGFAPHYPPPHGNGYVDSKKSDDGPHANGGPGPRRGSLAREPRRQRAGTRQEDTWRGTGDGALRVS